MAGLSNTLGLRREVYEELERVVGAENISDRPYILAGNRHAMPSSPVKPHSPAAVLLPKSTEEVAEIVKICNKHKVAYIAAVSSLIGSAYPTGPDTILLHLKRMDRIEEINAEDRYTIVEPGVRHAQLKTELMKWGLSYPVAAVGPGGSVLANFAAGMGENHNEYGASRTTRYLLGIEWVTPTGEIMRIGSLAHGAGWFCPDGPGPSLRGVLKGNSGQAGGLGVITKIAIGLDAWKGPAELPTEGRSPSYRIRMPKDCNKVLIFKFKTLDAIRDAMNEVGRSEIGLSVMKYFNATAALLATESANDFWELWNSGLFQKELAIPLYVYLSTWSAEELALEEKILREIVEETGGEEVDPRITALYNDNVDFYILVGFLQRVLRLGGGWAPNKLGGDSIHHIFDVAKTIPEFMDEFIDKKLILDAPDNFMIIPYEYGHGAHIELLFLWDRNLPEWGRIPMEFMRRSAETDIKHGNHGSMPYRGKTSLALRGPLYSNCHVWLNRIKDAFDPNGLSNPIP